MPVQRQYLQLLTDKTNPVDLPSGVFAVSIYVTQTKITKLITIPQTSPKTGKW